MTPTPDPPPPASGRDPAPDGDAPTRALETPTREFPEYAKGRARTAEDAAPGNTGWPDDADGIGQPIVPPRYEDAARVQLVERRGGGFWRGMFWFVATVGVVVALLLGVRVAGFWPTWANPFAAQETDRTQPPLLQSIQDLSRYTAAEGNFQVVIDLQNNRRYVPDFLLNERTLFVAAGSVDAYVDFSTIGDGAIVVSEDGTSVTVELPAPQLGDARLDMEQSYVFAEERGLLNRVGDLFDGDPNRQQEVYRLGERRIAEAAVGSGLAARAEENTRKMLEGLLRSLGYTTVTITFAEP